MCLAYLRCQSERTCLGYLRSHSKRMCLAYLRCQSKRTCLAYLRSHSERMCLAYLRCKAEMVYLVYLRCHSEHNLLDLKSIIILSLAASNPCYTVFSSFLQLTNWKTWKKRKCCVTLLQQHNMCATTWDFVRG